MQNVMKIGWSAAELMRIFDFQNGSRPPSWILYDVIADNSRLVFDGPNILLKLHVDRFYTLQDIVIFIFGPFGLKFPIYALLEEFLGDITPKLIPILSQPEKDRPWAKTHRMSHKSWKSITGPGRLSEKKYSITNTIQEKNVTKP